MVSPVRFMALLSTLLILICAPAHTFGQTEDAAKRHGPPKQADIHAQAEEQFRLGREAQAQGNFKRALRFFRTSQSMEPGRGKLLNIALCEKELGLLATAMQHFEEVLPLLDADDDRRAIVQENMTSLEPRLPHLRILLSRHAPLGTAVFYDDAELAPRMLGTDMLVDPGKHTIVVRSKRRPERRYEVTVGEGETKTIDAKPGDPPPAPPLPPPPPVTPTVQPATGGKRGDLFVVGGALVVAIGAITGGVALSDHANAERQCPTHEGCSAYVVDIASRGKTLSIVSTVAFAVGVAGVGTGLYFLLSPKSNATSPKLGVMLRPGGGGWAIQGTF